MIVVTALKFLVLVKIAEKYQLFTIGQRKVAHIFWIEIPQERQ